MIQQINIHEAKTQLSRLIERSLSGEEFIIAKAGKPVARLTPIKPPRPPRRRWIPKPCWPKSATS